MNLRRQAGSARAGRALITIALAGLASGCIAFQVRQKDTPDPAVAQKLKEAVPTYDQSWLASHNDFIQVGQLDAYLCNRGVIGTRSDDEVVSVLRQKAQAIGANGLSDISCGHGPTDELSGCTASIACSATALKIVTPADAAN